MSNDRPTAAEVAAVAETVNALRKRAQNAAGSMSAWHEEFYAVKDRLSIALIELGRAERLLNEIEGTAIPEGRADG